MNMVRRSLIEEPEISDRTLYAAAAALDPSIGELTFQQFQARYPRRVRRMELGGKRSARASRDPSALLPLEERPYVYAPGSSTLEPPEPEHEDAPEPSDADAQPRVRLVNGVRRVRTDVKPQGRSGDETPPPTSAELLLGEGGSSVSADDAAGERERAEPWPLRLHPEVERRVPPKAKRRVRARAAAGAERNTLSANGSTSGHTADRPSTRADSAAHGDHRQRLRDGIRHEIFRWARDLASAETHGDLVGVLARVDTHVNAITQLLEDGGAIGRERAAAATPGTASSAKPAPSAVAVPAPRPPVAAGKLIRSYKPSELDAMVRWVAGKRTSATDDEIVQAVVEELGFQRRGRRITTELLESLRRVRGGA